MARTKTTQRKKSNIYIQAIRGVQIPRKDFELPEKLKTQGLAIKRRQARKDIQRQEGHYRRYRPGTFALRHPWVLNFPPCRGPGGSILTGNVASVVSSNCPLWEERRENTTRLPWVATRKPEEGILEVESYWEFGLS